MEARSEGSKWVEVLVEGTIGRNNALRLADAKQASALPVSVICHFIFEQPCGSPRLAFATHSRSMPRQASAAAKSAASSSTSTSSGSRAARPPRRAAACQAPAGRHRRRRSSGESSRQRRRVCHRGRRAGRMRRCTTAHLSRRCPDPGQLAQHPFRYLSL